MSACVRPCMSKKVIRSPKDRCFTKTKNEQASLYTAPVGGTVVAVNRGERRVFESLVIAVDPNASEEITLMLIALKICQCWIARQLLSSWSLQVNGPPYALVLLAVHQKLIAYLLPFCDGDRYQSFGC